MLLRTPLLLCEADETSRELLRQSKANPGDEELRERAARAVERSGDHSGGLRIRHEHAIRDYVGHVRTKNNLRRHVDTAYWAAQPHGIMVDLNRKHSEAHDASEKARLHLYNRLTPPKEQQHPHAWMQARLVRQGAAHVIDRSFFPKGEEGDHDHHEVLADLHQHRPERRMPDSRGRSYRNTTGRDNPTRHHKHQEFQRSLASHGYGETHNIKSVGQSERVTIMRKESKS